MRKRLYTALVPTDLPCADPADCARAAELAPAANTPSAAGGDPGDDDDTPIPVIHNIVSTAQIDSSRMPMDLQAISRVIPGSSYDRRKFAAMTIRLANPSCTLLLFSSGKLVVTGGKSWYEGVLSCLRVARFLQETLVGVDFWLRSCDVQVPHAEIPVIVEAPLKEAQHPLLALPVRPLPLRGRQSRRGQPRLAPQRPEPRLAVRDEGLEQAELGVHPHVIACGHARTPNMSNFPAAPHPSLKYARPPRQNIVAHAEIPVQPGVLDLDAMYTRLNLHCTYQKNMFPGLIYRPHASPVVLLCFYSGKVVITGGRTVRDVNEGWRRLWPTVRVFVKTEAGAAPPAALGSAPPPSPPKRVIFKPLQEHLERKRRLAEAAEAERQAKRAEASARGKRRPEGLHDEL
jgi:TATA-box binding protein (TBP) (component of TFIID and TFIIIB)